jgi:hypothetical protein
VHFHSFRKTWQTLGAGHGVNQRAAQEILGHSDPSPTANVYTDIPACRCIWRQRRFRGFRTKGTRSDAMHTAVQRNVTLSGLPCHLLTFSSNCSFWRKSLGTMG